MRHALRRTLAPHSGVVGRSLRPRLATRMVRYGLLSSTLILAAAPSALAESDPGPDSLVTTPGIHLQLLPLVQDDEDGLDLLVRSPILPASAAGKDISVKLSIPGSALCDGVFASSQDSQGWRPLDRSDLDCAGDFVITGGSTDAQSLVGKHLLLLGKLLVSQDSGTDPIMTYTIGATFSVGGKTIAEYTSRITSTAGYQSGGVISETVSRDADAKKVPASGNLLTQTISNPASAEGRPEVVFTAYLDELSGSSAKPTVFLFRPGDTAEIQCDSISVEDRTTGAAIPLGTRLCADDYLRLERGNVASPGGVVISGKVQFATSQYDLSGQALVLSDSGVQRLVAYTTRPGAGMQGRTNPPTMTTAAGPTTSNDSTVASGAPSASQTSTGGPIAVAAILALIALAVAGGYWVYRKRSGPHETIR